MFKKLFSWEYALVIFPCSYGLAFLLWRIGLVHEPFKIFFCSAVAIFAFAFLWSLAALWTSDSFRKPRVKYPDNYPRADSDRSSPRPPRRRRRRNKELRRVLAGCSVLLFAGTGYKVYTSFTTYVAVRKLATLEVYLSDTERVKAIRVPFRVDPDAEKDMMFAMPGVPSKEITVHPGDSSIKINVVIRNISEVAVHNGYVMITSNVPLQPGYDGMTVMKPNELFADAREILPSKNDSEFSVPVNIPISDDMLRAGVLVSVVGDGMKSYAAAARIVLIREKAREKPVIEKPVQGTP